jgi:hypothetical protein
MLLVILIAIALMQLYRAQMKLKINCEELTGQVECDGEQINACVTAAYARTYQDAQKIAELEAKLKALTAEKVDSTGFKPTTVTDMADAKAKKSIATQIPA